MREILFRGKRVNDDEWVYGNIMTETREGEYYSSHDGSHNKQLGMWNVLSIQEQTDDADVYVVNIKTVGQYTGLTDKNGKKIFEGDILKAFKHNEIQFIKKVKYASGVYWFGNWNWIEFQTVFRSLEVIGNIYDNPELLKEVE